MGLYSTSQAARLAGVSVSTIRNVTTGKYAAPYADLWSAGVTPGTGAGRLFTERDLAILRYIRGETSKGRPHAAIADDIRAGVMSDLPQEEDQAAGEESATGAPRGEGMPGQSDQAAAMVVYGAFDMLKTSLAEAHEREQELSERLIDAERRAAAAEARAQALEAQLAERRRGMLARLFGR